MFGNKKNASDAELEAIANRKIVESVISISIARSIIESKAFLESSRVLKGLMAQQKKQQKKQKRTWLKKKISVWIGVDSVIEQQQQLIELLANRFKHKGDVIASIDATYHVNVLAVTAESLKNYTKEMEKDDSFSEGDIKDILLAAERIQDLASVFSPIDKTNDNYNNDNSEKTNSS